MARLHTDSSQQEWKARYDASHRSVEFCKGDEVLLWTPIRTSPPFENFLHRYLGPYVVVEQVSPVNYCVSLVDIPTDRRCRGTEIVHVSRLKRFNRRQP